ncbi:UNVERIFIED_CONTAM: hypothetical protein FKN15_004297 [Acipenser sinensis]
MYINQDISFSPESVAAHNNDNPVTKLPDGSVVPRGRIKALLYCATIKSAFRFTYRWQRIEDNKEPLTLENTRSVIEVRRKNYPVDYQCDTYENDSLTSTVRFTVHESLVHDFCEIF